MLTGWGRTSPVSANVVRPLDGAEVEAILTDPATSNVIARGFGRSYGDAAQRSGGRVIDVRSLDDVSPPDEAGRVVVGAGASLHKVINTVLQHGWFIAVTPGTRYVSVGGAIAADVHGKNHHRDGSFASHVLEFCLATPTGTVSVRQDSDPELFWATMGGMGLTGVITSATLQLMAVETPWVRASSKRFTTLSELMSVMESTDDRYRYSVAWLDCSRSLRSDYRAVLTQGNLASADDLRNANVPRERLAASQPRLRVPSAIPVRLVNSVTTRIINTAWYQRSGRRKLTFEPLTSFFYPLDGIENWNRLYGHRGFLQYQIVVREPATMREIVNNIAVSGVPSFLAVLKRLGPGNPGPLSFCSEGWTLAVDFPIGPDGLSSLLDGLDLFVANAGGRVYLAKDSRLRPELFEAMYPRKGDFEAVRRRVDPNRVLASDLSCRLGIG